MPTQQSEVVLVAYAILHREPPEDDDSAHFEYETEESAAQRQHYERDAANLEVEVLIRDQRISKTHIAHPGSGT